MTIRVIDVLCQQHREEVWTLGRWPQTIYTYVPEFDEHRPNCQKCRATARHLPARFQTEYLPDFTPAQREWVNALHEAGHAVTNILMGLEVIEAAVLSHPDAPGSTGYVEHWSGAGEELRSAIGSWGGQLATERWLRHQRLDTAANVFDCRFGSNHDSRTIEEKVGARAAVAAGRQAEDALAGEWSDVLEVAEQLLQRGLLTGEQIKGIMRAPVGCYA